MYQGCAQGDNFSKAPSVLPPPLSSSPINGDFSQLLYQQDRVIPGLMSRCWWFYQSASPVWEHCGSSTAINKALAPLLAARGWHPSVALGAPHSPVKTQLCFIKSTICTSKYLCFLSPCKKSWSFVCIPSGVQELWLLNSNPRILAIKMPRHWLPVFFFSPEVFLSLRRL